MTIRGIDVSKHQGEIDWVAVKNSGIDFAIIRAGHGLGNEDPYFKSNVANAKAAGIQVGTYWYSYAKSIEEAIQEAQYFLDIIKGYEFDYPVVFDIEDPSQKDLGQQLLTDMTKAFLNTLQESGYYAMVYTSKYWFTSVLDDSQLSDYAHWLAQYADQPTYTGSYGIWQYSSTGSVDGISGDVDMNYTYVDYPTIIKTAGLNGFEKEEKPKMKNLVVFGKKEDKPAAEMLAYKLGCPVMDADIPFDYTVIENVYCVGAPGRLPFTGYAKVVITGTDQSDTMQKVLNFNIA